MHAHIYLLAQPYNYSVDVMVPMQYYIVHGNNISNIDGFDDENDLHFNALKYIYYALTGMERGK